jgi:Fic/DOC family protein
LKTINVPLIGKCPAWTEDIPRGRDAEFKAVIAQLRRLIHTAAVQTIVMETEPCRWHGLLFAAFVPVPYYAGNYRGADRNFPCLQQNVAVQGRPGSEFQWVRFDVGVAFEHFRKQSTALELRWVNLDATDRAVQLATIIGNLVGTFIKIHPFLNGNGRLSRLLWEWCLMRFGVRPQCRVHPRPDPPYSDLMKHAMVGNYLPLILAILEHLRFHAPQQN